MTTATVDVDPDTYLSAGDAFFAVNDAVCDLVSAAATAAGSGGGMAGTDSGGTEWSARYDPAARQALAAGAGLADRLGELGVALTISGDNHAGADDASAPTTAPAYPVAPAARTPVSVLPAAPPSAAGGSTPPPSGWSMVAHLLPFSWPGADPARLRTVATGWATAASGLQDAADRITGPVGDLAGLQSPEVEAAVTRCTDVQLAIRSLAQTYSLLGRACNDQADNVQQAHDSIHAAFSDAGDLVSATLDIAVGAVTGDDVGGKVRKLVETLTDVLEQLQKILDTVVDFLQDVLDQITALIKRLADLVTTIVTVGFSIAGVAPAAVAAATSSAQPRIDLQAMEGDGEDDGHTIREHVGKSGAELVERARDDGLEQTSSFTDLPTAEALTASNIAANSAWISRWLRKQKTTGQLVIRSPAPSSAGLVYDATSKSFVAPRTVVTVLDKNGRGTFIVLTSYLEP